MNKRMSLIEYLIFKYHKTVTAVCNAPQGGENKKEMAAAQSLVDKAQTACELAALDFERQKEAHAAQVAAEAESRSRAAAAETAEAASRQAEAAARAAEAENKTALAELEKQEAAFHGAIAALENTIATETGTVKRNKAVAELEQLKASDPQPLRTAKINQGATVRKAEKASNAASAATAAAAAATAAAKDALAAAEAAVIAAGEAALQLEAAVQSASNKLQEALDYLQEVKNMPGQSFGDIWWMEREIAEKKKYLPKSRQ